MAWSLYGSNDHRHLSQEIFGINVLRIVKSAFEASWQACSAILTTIWRPGLRLMTARIFKKFFLRDQNSQHFKEDLVAVNASAFSFASFFEAIDYTGAYHYVISAKLTTLENFW